MNYYTAPMEGLTDRIWRQAHQRWFGAPGAPARYYAPFISPPENRVLIKKKMAELDPAANPGAPVIPQLLAKDGALAAWMIGELRKMGYTEVNLNFGCPAPKITARSPMGRGREKSVSVRTQRLERGAVPLLPKRAMPSPSSSAGAEPSVRRISQPDWKCG